MGTRVPRSVAVLVGIGLGAALVPGAAEAVPSAQGASAAVDCSWTSSPLPLDEAFRRAGQAAGVPADVVKAVSYLQSRWDDHGGLPSADGGYGPMNLTDLPGEASAQTARLGARLTGLPLGRVKTDPVANVCAGAAVLASYGGDGDAADRSAAVARYGGPGFAHQVFTTLHDGQSRVTAQGDAVTLAPQPDVVVPAVAKTPSVADCPPQLGCEWLPAPYQKADPDDPDSTGDYGNHSLADRTGPGGPRLKYIVIHDTEGSYDGSVRLAQDPAYLAWNYTIRSGDGHIAQHLDAKDIGWHAGNWYMNMHSIGIEHEGKAGTGGWYTEAMYRQSAALVRYLATKYGIPINPAHIIGHDQVSGATMGATRGAHWDPGPYWDWEHYFDLLGAPIGGKKSRAGDVRVGDVVTVRPGYAGNANTLTQCQEQSPGSGPCWPGAPTNFATLHQAPDELSPLAKDVAAHPTGSPDGTTAVNDVSARAQAGTRLVVAAMQGDWVQVAWAGESAWIHNPPSRPVLVRTARPTVTVRPGLPSAPVYGRAYPESAAYRSPGGGPPVTPVEYTLKPGQQYVLTDRKVVTDVYGAGSFGGTSRGDRTDLVGRDVYYQVAIAHRVFWVRAADVQVREPAVIVRRARPAVAGQPAVGERLTARPGVWSGAPVTLRFRWLRDGRPIPGASSAAYTPTPQDVGHRLRFSVTASSVNADDVRATSKAARVLH